MVLRILLEVNEVIDKKLKPVISKYNCDVKVKTYNNGILGICLTGTWGICSSEKFIISDLILRRLKKEIPEVKDVVIIN